MNATFQITDFVHLNSRGLFRKENMLYPKSNEISLADFLKSIYKELNLAYPKFYKMDLLSKMGLICTEILLQKSQKDKNTALVFQNNAGSLSTDLEHQKSISQKENAMASPAVFVYTLPNIVMGEIAIKHNLKSENAFFIAENFTPDFIHTYTSILLQTNKANSAICGWIDLYNDRYNVFLALISNKGKIGFTPDNLKQLYHSVDE